MIEPTTTEGYFCNVCAHEWTASGSREANLRTPDPAVHRLHDLHGSRIPGPGSRRYHTLDDLIARTGVRRDELATLAEIGALNAFGYDRRTALWQIEKAVRATGELFNEAIGVSDSASRLPHPIDSVISTDPASRLPHPIDSVISTDPASRVPDPDSISPLRPMTPPERLMADYAGTSLTIGPHPLALRRAELALRGVLRASDLPRARHGRRVRVAGAVITRQRPGTAKGFVFLTLEDETGIANVIVRPDLFTEQKRAIVGEPYLLVEGTLQIQEGVTSIKAERVLGLSGGGPEPQSHDFR
jgi:error-prone DNA polymerase